MRLLSLMLGSAMALFGQNGIYVAQSSAGSNNGPRFDALLDRILQWGLDGKLMTRFLVLFCLSVGLNAQILSPIMFGVDPDVKTPVDTKEWD